MKTTANQEHPKQVSHNESKILIDNEDINQDMTVNVKPIFSYVKGTIRVILKERKKKRSISSLMLMFQACLNCF